jgi:ATP-dependent RNA circularization protein (DNA/RNA ligase family)
MGKYLIAWVLTLFTAAALFAQSGSFGNTFIHSTGEMAIYGQHDFRNGGSGILPGIVGTERTAPIGRMSFVDTATWINAVDTAHVDGFVTSYKTTSFIFPIGDNGNYQPAAVSKSSLANPTTAAYYFANPTTAITSSLKGGNEPVLPNGGPYPSATKAADIQSVSIWEYWDIDGTTAAQITLTWDANSNVSAITGADLSKLTIVGWNGTQWVRIPSTVNVSRLNITNSNGGFTGAPSTLTIGSITTNAEIVPGTYTIYTLAGRDLSDTDGDDIPDLIDIDDDNDGILDAVEAPSCYYTEAEADSLTSISTGLLYLSPDNINTLRDGNIATTESFNFTAGQALAGDTIVQFTTLTNAPLDTVIIDMASNLAGTIGFGVAGATGKLEGWNGTAWVDLSTTTNLNATTLGNIYFPVTLNTTPWNYTSFRIMGVAIANTNANMIAEVRLSFPTTYTASAHPKLSCTTDTDGDGITNDKDVDSDGDGCSDAYEAQTTLNKTANYQFPIATTLNGGNGFYDSLQSIADSNAYKGIYTYQYAIDTTLNMCIDSDNDGVGDLIDIDDDNDGILDVVECPYSTGSFVTLTAGEISVPSQMSYLNYPNSISTLLQPLTSLSSTTSGNSMLWDQETAAGNGGVLDGNFVNQLIVNPSTSINNLSGIALWAPSVTPTYGDGPVREFTITVTYSGGTWTSPVYITAQPTTSGEPNTGQYFSFGQTFDGVTNVTMNTLNGWFNTNTGYSAGAQGTTWESTTSAKALADWAVNNQTYNMSLAAFRLMSGGSDGGTYCDTDGDGIPNTLDLDSDGDGCSDAKESGVTSLVSTTPAPAGMGATTGLANSVAPSPYSGNGFSDALQSATDTNAYKGTYTYQYATSSFINLCTDTDNDGISDFIDIDDDNDGVLDAVEAPSCYYIATEINTITNIATGIANASTIANTIDGNLATTFSFTNAQNLANDTVFVFSMPTYVELDTVYIDMSAANGFGTNNTAKARLQGWNGTTWVNLTDSIVVGGAITGGNIYFPINQNKGKYLEYRILGLSGTTSSAYLISEVVTSLVTNYTPSSYPKLNCTTDTDGDGILNQLDVDSDNDGCYDAYESGTVTTNIDTVAAPYGGNGFADAIQAIADTNAYKGTYTYQYATSSFINLCADTDGDGILDITDVDDDNDGILDAVEAPSCYYTETEADSLISISTGLLYASPDNINTLIDGNIATTEPFNFTTGQALAGDTIVQFTTLTNAPLDTVIIDMASNTAGAIGFGAAGATGKLQGWNGTTWVDLSANINLNSTTLGNIFFPVTLNTTPWNYTSFRIMGVGIANTNANTIAEVRLSFPTNYTASAHPKLVCTTDTDGDGITNNLDLDSDNDGCVDAIEGGASILPSQLVSAGGIATVGTGSTASNQNLCGDASCVSTSGTNIGLPQLTSPTNYSNTTGQTINTSQDSLVNTCLDSDGDGYPNDIDLDDDNDGILDTDENTCYNYKPAACNLGIPFSFEDTAAAAPFPTPSNAGSLNSVPPACWYKGLNTVDYWNTPVTHTVYLAAATIPPSPDGGMFVGFNGNSAGIGTSLTSDANGGESAKYDLTGLTPGATYRISWWQMLGGWGPGSSGVFNVGDSAYFKINLGVTGSVNSAEAVNFKMTWKDNGTLNGNNNGTTTIGERDTWVQAYVDIVAPVANPTIEIKIMRNPGNSIFLYGLLDGLSIVQTTTATGSSVGLCDLDGDGIPNTLDLDTDGDGCPDAIEGGAAFTNVNLSNSSMPGGSTNVTTNLGDSVGTTPTTIGVPVIAGTGQSIGTSQNALVQDTACTLYKVFISTPDNCTTPSIAPSTITGTTSAPNLVVMLWVDGVFVDSVLSDSSGNWTWTVPSGSNLNNPGTHQVEAYLQANSYIANGDGQYTNTLIVTSTANPDPSAWADAIGSPYLNISGGLSSTGTSSMQRATTADGQYMYWADFDGIKDTVYILDMSNPYNPTVVGRFRSSTYPFSIVQEIDVDIKNNYLAVGGYYSNGTFKFETNIFDISTPTAPVLVKTLDSINNFTYSNDNNYAYAISTPLAIAVSQDYFNIYDNATPSNPVLMASLALPANFMNTLGFNNSATKFNLSPSGDTLYIMGTDTLTSPNSNPYLVIVDITDKTAPSIIYSAVMPIAHTDITYSSAVVDNPYHIYYSTSQGYYVLDVTNPTAPIYIDSLNMLNLDPSFRFGALVNTSIDGNYIIMAADRFVGGVSHPSIYVIDPILKTIVKQIDRSITSNSADIMNIGSGSQDMICLNVAECQLDVSNPVITTIDPTYTYKFGVGSVDSFNSATHPFNLQPYYEGLELGARGTPLPLPALFELEYDTMGTSNPYDDIALYGIAYKPDSASYGMDINLVELDITSILNNATSHDLRLFIQLTDTLGNPLYSDIVGLVDTNIIVPVYYDILYNEYSIGYDVYYSPGAFTPNSINKIFKFQLPNPQSADNLKVQIFYQKYPNNYVDTATINNITFVSNSVIPCSDTILSNPSNGTIIISNIFVDTSNTNVSDKLTFTLNGVPYEKILSFSSLSYSGDSIVLIGLEAGTYTNIVIYDYDENGYLVCSDTISGPIVLNAPVAPAPCCILDISNPVITTTDPTYVYKFGVGQVLPYGSDITPFTPVIDSTTFDTTYYAGLETGIKGAPLPIPTTFYIDYDTMGTSSPLDDKYYYGLAYLPDSSSFGNQITDVEIDMSPYISWPPTTVLLLEFNITDTNGTPLPANILHLEDTSIYDNQFKYRFIDNGNGYIMLYYYKTGYASTQDQDLIKFHLLEPQNADNIKLNFAVLNGATTAEDTININEVSFISNTVIASACDSLNSTTANGIIAISNVLIDTTTYQAITEGGSYSTTYIEYTKDGVPYVNKLNYSANYFGGDSIYITGLLPGTYTNIIFTIINDFSGLVACSDTIPGPIVLNAPTAPAPCCDIDLSAATVDTFGTSNKFVVSQTSADSLTFPSFPLPLIDLSSGAYGSTLPFPTTYTITTAGYATGVSYGFDNTLNTNVTNVKVDYTYGQYAERDVIYIMLLDTLGNVLAGTSNILMSYDTAGVDYYAYDTIAATFISFNNNLVTTPANFVSNFILDSPQPIDNIRVGLILEDQDGGANPPIYTFNSIEAITDSVISCPSTFDGSLLLANLGLKSSTQYGVSYIKDGLAYKYVLVNSSATGDSIELINLAAGEYSNIYIYSIPDTSCFDSISGTFIISQPPCITCDIDLSAASGSSVQNASYGSSVGIDTVQPGYFAPLAGFYSSPDHEDLSTGAYGSPLPLPALMDIAIDSSVTPNTVLYSIAYTPDTTESDYLITDIRVQLTSFGGIAPLDSSPITIYSFVSDTSGNPINGLSTVSIDYQTGLPSDFYLFNSIAGAYYQIHDLSNTDSTVAIFNLHLNMPQPVTNILQQFFFYATFPDTKVRIDDIQFIYQDTLNCNVSSLDSLANGILLLDNLGLAPNTPYRVFYTYNGIDNMTPTMSVTSSGGDLIFLNGLAVGTYTNIIVEEVSTLCRDTIAGPIVIGFIEQCICDTINIDTTICFGDTVYIGTVAHTTTGSYSDTLTSASGCDSIINLDLTVLPLDTMTLAPQMICFGDTVYIGTVAHTTTGSYSDTLTSASGCDSIINLDLTVLPLDTMTLAPQTICFGDTVYIGTVAHTTTGSYSDTLTSASGCDSIINLDLTVLPLDTMTLAPQTICFGDTVYIGTVAHTTTGSYSDTLTSASGCDSIINLDLTVLPLDTMTLAPQTICFGDTVYIGTVAHTTTGSYSDTLTSASGCDSIINLDLTVLPLDTMTLAPQTICFGDTVYIGTVAHTTTGSYSDTLTSASGCDSIINLDLTVLPLDTMTLAPQTICFGDTVYIGTVAHTTTGSYSDTLTSASGCDSIINLDLTVLPLDTMTLAPQMICFGDTVYIGTVAHTTTGSYSDTLTSASGCDSIINLDLTVLPLDTMTLAPQTICFGDTVYIGTVAHTTTGSYSDTLTSASGCDSIINLDLTVLPLDTMTLAPQTICFGDTVYIGTVAHTTTGSYSDTLTSASGCDSIINLDLTVLPLDTMTLAPQTICFGDTVYIGTVAHTTTGSYSDTLTSASGCDSIINLDLTVLPLDTMTLAPQTICFGDTVYIGTVAHTTTGSYSDTLTSASGCDSIINLDLTVLPLDTMTLAPQTICFGDTVYIGTVAHTTTGSYSDTLTSASGCDSIINLDLTVLPLDTMTLAPQTICFGDTVYIGTVAHTTTGSYSDTLTSASGCDSIINLDLTVLPLDTMTLAPQTICFGDTVYIGTVAHTTTGSYSDTLTSASGCDSIINLDLTVLPLDTMTRTVGICSGGTYTVCSNTYSSAGTYKDTCININGCDSIITTILTFANQIEFIQNIELCLGDSVVISCTGNIYKTAGTFNDTCTATLGCDSIITTNITLDLCVTDTVIVIPVCDTCIETVCLDTILNITEGSWTLCDGSTTATSGLGTYSIDSTTGCITYTANGIIGIDTLCIVVCDSTKAVCDTVIIVVPIIPTTEVITDTITIDSTGSVCVAIEEGMNADNVSIVNCDGTLDNITTPSTTVGDSCVSVTYTGTNIGTDKFCVVVCDTVLDVCDTTEVIVTVIPTDTVPVIPVCDTCTETVCLDTILNITEGSWTLCDGSTTATSGLGTYSIDSTTGCITYTANGIIGIDTLCIVVCDSTKAVCDTVIIVVPIIPTTEVITDTITIDSTGSVCVAIEEGMNADNVSIVNCDGTLDNITTPSTTVGDSCVSVTYTGTNIGTDKFCVVVCDTVLDVCDTTEVIVTVIPRDTVPVIPVCDTCTETVCLDTILNITEGSWTLCDGSTTATSGLGTYSIDSTTGCITYTANGIIGIDTLCIVVCDSTKAVCDTVIIVVPIIPTTEVITDTITIDSTGSVCVAIEEGMNADNVSIVNCDGTLDNITTPSTTVGDSCVSVTYTGTNIGTDKFCVVVCDTVLDVCDTTEVIVTVIPTDTVPVIPVCDTCTETVCLDTILNITEGSWTLCDGSTTATSGLGTYSIDSTTGCITYTANGIIGIDTLCIVVCDSTKAVCDTVIIVVPIIPTTEVITDTITIDSTGSVCVAIEEGMNADNVSIVNCDGTLDNITTPSTTVGDSCVSVTYTGTNIGTDKFCVVVCDTVLDVCDTTEVIVTVIPRDTVPVIPVCDTCTETVCLDTILNITEGSWTLCDGSTTATSGLGTYSIDSTTGCITYTANGIIGIDTLCIVVCDSTKAVCDTVIIVVPIIPTTEVITDTITIDSTGSVCVAIEEGMNADNVSIVNCDGTLDNITTPSTTVGDSCVSVTYTGTNIGTDKFCVVVCDTVLDVCDTTEVIVTVIPTDTVPVIPVCDTCTETVCLDTILNITEGSWTLCDGSTTATSGLGTYSIDSTTGCITYTANGIIGIDTLCIVVCDSTKAVCDTVIIVVPIIPTTEVITDTITIDSTGSVCVAIEEGMNADNVSIVNCDGTLDNITTPSTTVGDSCVSVTYTGTNIGTDKFCVVVCDTVLDVCDTTEVIVTVIPRDTVPVIPVCDTCTETVCLDTILNITEGSWTLCDGSTTATSGLGTYSIDSTTGCITYTANGIIGIDTLCIVVCDSTKAVCDTVIIVVPIIPTTEVITDTITIDSTGSVCVAIEEGMNADNVSIVNCDGTLDNITTPSTTVGDSCVSVTYTGTNIGTDKFCVVVCDTVLDVCDTTEVIVTVIPRDTVPVIPVCDTCTETVCLDTILNITEGSWTLCDGSTTATSGLGTYSIDSTTGCITYTANGIIGIDTLCIVVCDSTKAVCDTVIIVVPIIPTTEVITDTITIDSTGSVCVAIEEGMNADNVSIVNCDGTLDNITTPSTTVGDSCVSVTYTGTNIGTDKFCVVVCDTVLDVCDTTEVIVTVIPTDTVPVIPVCDTCTETVCLDTILNITEGSWTLCDGSTTATSGLGTYSIDSTTGCITYTANGIIGIDTLCIVVCDSTKAVCDTVIIVVPIIPTTEVITDTITIDSTGSVCVAIEEGMNADNVSIVNCDGTLDNITTPSTTVGDSCVSVTYTGTNIGTDKFCVVVCDTVLDVCDTTEVIVTVIPRDTVPVIPVCDTCTETVCLDTILNITEGSWTLCDGSTTATSGLGTYSIDSTTGCITYTANGIIGIDTLCIVVCDSTKAVCDTVIIVVPIIPTTEVITDTITIDSTGSVCVAIEEGMNADNVSIVNCDGTLDNITTPSTTVGDSCVSVTYTGTNIGTDKFCVVVCDTVLDVCDTTEVIVTVIPTDTVPVIPVCDTCTETVCLDTILNITEGSWTLCDGSTTATSGLGTYSIDSTTGCITYTANGIIGIDTLCIVVCDSTKAVCDTVIIVVPIIPTTEVITDTITIDSTGSICVAIEEGMNADNVSIVNCDGTLDNITTPSTTVGDSCVSVTYTGTNIGTDKFCVVVCDTVLDVCDTTEVIVTVIPTDTVPVIPVCDTCTETVCLDTILNITEGSWTLCDGSTTATSGLGTYSIDSTTGCITYTANGIIGIDTLCIVVCDSTKAVCDTVIIVVPIIPTTEVITDTITIDSTGSVCVAIEEGMNADNVSIVNCDGTLDNITTPSTTVGDSCVSVTYTGTNIGTDKFCVVVCDTVLDVCDTTEVIVTVIPTDTVPVIPVCDTCTETVCLDTILNITEGSWTLCDGSTTATSGLGTYSIDSTTGCITYTANGIIGIDTLCIVVCDSTKAVCDTVIIVVPIIPTTEVITDTITIDSTGSVCVAIEEGMNADNVSIVNCDGTLDNITTPSTTVGDSCVSVTYTGTNIGTDKFCVVVCDTVLDVCDTTEVIVTVIPRDTVIVIPVCDTCTETVCLDTILNITEGSWTLCDGSTTATSGLGTYSIDSTTGCITYTANGIIGIDTLCIVVCDSTKAVCDTVIIVVPIIPTTDVIRDTNIINTIDTLCVGIEEGMTAGTTTVGSCSGTTLSNTYTVTGAGCIEIDRSGTVGYNVGYSMCHCD